jgi:hypothetical protein
MVNYLSFHNSSFALRYFLMSMARPQCDTPLVYIGGTGSTVGEVSFNLNRWWRTCHESMVGITGYALEHALAAPILT